MSKNKILLSLCVAAAAFLLQGCCNPNEAIGTQAVVLKPQETNNWCWASTTQMITEFLGHGRSQCDLANQRFNMTTCCTGACPKNPDCNMPGWTMFAESNFDFKSSATPLSWDDIQGQIYCTKKPMAFAYGRKTGGVGHVVVVSGYVDIGGTRFLALTDPWNPCAGNTRFITYDEYSNSPTNNHWATEYDITYKN